LEYDAVIANVMTRFRIIPRKKIRFTGSSIPIREEKKTRIDGNIVMRRTIKEAPIHKKAYLNSILPFFSIRPM
jgi:hypothetical protein